MYLFYEHNQLLQPADACRALRRAVENRLLGVLPWKDVLLIIFINIVELKTVQGCDVHLRLLFHSVPRNWGQMPTWASWRRRGWDRPFACGLKFLLPPAGLPTMVLVGFGIDSSLPSPSLDLLQEWMLLGGESPKKTKILLSTVL